MYLLILNFNIALVNVIFEFNFGTYLFLFPLFASFPFLFPLPKNRSSLALIYILMLMLHGMSFLLVSLYPSEHLEIQPNLLFTQLNYGFAFALTLMIVLMYSVLQSQQKFELDAKIIINEQQKQLLEETLRDKNILLSEIHHRTKNNLAIVSSMLNLQRNQIENEELQQILLDCSNRVHSMATVHQKLYEKENFTKIDLKEYLEELIRDLQKTIFPKDIEIQLIMEIDSFNITSEKAIPCALIVNELITNSVKHAFKAQGGKLEIKIKKIGHQILLMIYDNGPGFHFDLEQNQLSLGMTLIQALTEQLNGQFEYNTKNGTTFNLSFKLN
jgi:two-component sensor histidine kinase